MKKLGVTFLFVVSPQVLGQEAIQTLSDRIARELEDAGCPPETITLNRELTADQCHSDSLLCIRIENQSSIDFDSFVINFPNQAQEYGPISAGATSTYRQVGCAYSYNRTIAYSGGRRYVRGINDHIGDPFLSAGTYTLRYTVDEFQEPRGTNSDVYGRMDDELVIDGDLP